MHQLCVEKEAFYQNFQIFVVTKNVRYSKEIEKVGLHFISHIMSSFRLDIVYYVMIKPVIHDSIISRILNIRVFNAINSLGYNFIEARQSIVLVIGDV